MSYVLIHFQDILHIVIEKWLVLQHRENLHLAVLVCLQLSLRLRMDLLGEVWVE